MRTRYAVLACVIALMGSIVIGAQPAAASNAMDPGVLVVQTVPSVPGARIAADGRMATAGRKGIARLRVRHFVGLEGRFNAPQTRVADDRRVMFDRVRGQLHNAFNGQVIEVGLRTERLVRWTFVDRQANPVDPGRLSRMVIKSSTGQILTLQGADLAEPRWLAASRTQQTSNGLMSKDIYWTVQSVVLDGSELVNRSQQRFVPDESTWWDIELLFFRAQISSTDLLFGNSAGSGVEVTSPDGTVARHPFDDDGQVVLPAVPRGEYQMQVYGSGISFGRPVSLSKDQEVDLQVISALDVALIGLTLALLAVSLLLIGRRRTVTTWSTARRRSPVDSRTDPLAEDPTGARRPTALVLSTLLVVVVALAGPATGRSAALPAGAAPTGTGDQAPSAAVSGADSPTPVLAYYYIWFTPTSWNRAKIDYPLLGRYSSDDEVIMAKHIETASAAGIDGFLVSWKRSTHLNNRLDELERIATTAGFKLGIVYQGLDFAREPLPVDRVREDLTWFADQYAHDPTFHVFGDRPLIVWTGTQRFTAAEIASVTRPLADRLQVLASAKNVEDYQRISRWVQGNAYYWSSVKPDMGGYPEKLQEMSDAVHADGGLWIAPFAPGFDARMVGGSSVVPRNGGQTLRQELAAAQSSNPDALGLISWNEFSENTHVEPSEEQGTTALHALALALGATPPPAPADSSETVAGVGGLTGWGALVTLGLVLALLNLLAYWLRNRATTEAGAHDSTTRGRGPDEDWRH